MPETIDPSSRALAVTTVLDQSQESHIDQLHRAAIGPINAAYYLPILSRFETYDRGSPSWNWAASLCTLNWMLFRGLWTPALAYLGGLLLAVFAVFAWTRLAAPMAQSVEWGLWAGLATLAWLVPGFFGNAWLFGHYRLRLARALNATPTLAAACQLLARQASSHRRLALLVVLNAMLVTVLLGAWFWPRTPSQVSARVDQGTVAGLAEPARSAASAADTPLATGSTSAPEPAASEPGSAGIPADTAGAQGTNAATTSTDGAQAADPAASDAATASAGAASTTEPAPLAPTMATAATAPAEPASAAAPALAPALSHAAADAAIRHAAIAARARKAHREPRPAPRAAAAEATTPVDTKPAPKAQDHMAQAANGRFLVNVGLFAQDDNARRAFERLVQAGLPATTQELQTGKGKRTRVRVGPYATRAQADAAAVKIRALQLDAVVIRP